MVWVSLSVQKLYRVLKLAVSHAVNFVVFKIKFKLKFLVSMSHRLKFLYFFLVDPPRSCGTKFVEQKTHVAGGFLSDKTVKSRAPVRDMRNHRHQLESCQTSKGVPAGYFRFYG